MIAQSLVPCSEIGQRLLPAGLFEWIYSGLSGEPAESNASRRYTRGIWVLTLNPHADGKRRTRVEAIRTKLHQKQWWAQRAAL